MYRQEGLPPSAFPSSQLQFTAVRWAKDEYWQLWVTACSLHIRAEIWVNRNKRWSAKWSAQKSIPFYSWFTARSLLSAAGEVPTPLLLRPGCLRRLPEPSGVVETIQSFTLLGTKSNEGMMAPTRLSAIGRWQRRQTSLTPIYLFIYLFCKCKCEIWGHISH